ncbi:conserved hypothetical protein [Vibrio diabolicus]|nr:conserved hypothetical protein [Vibrio diabolicus]
MPSLKLTQDVRWIEEKYAKVPYFTAFKLAKDTGFELEQQIQRNLALTKFSQRQRNHTREITRKLETVNDKLKAKTSHLVPPERT